MARPSVAPELDRLYSVDCSWVCFVLWDVILGWFPGKIKLNRQAPGCQGFTYKK